MYLYTFSPSFQDLKEECERFLRSKLSTDNACHLLLLADLHNAPLLREGAVEFVANNPVQQVNKTVFDDVLSNKGLTKDIILALSAKTFKLE